MNAEQYEKRNAESRQVGPVTHAGRQEKQRDENKEQRYREGYAAEIRRQGLATNFP